MVLPEEEWSKRTGMPFATGKLGGEFRLLRAYIENAGTKEIVPERNIFDLIRSMALVGSTVEEVINAVTEIFIKKIEPSAALRAYRTVYGVEVSEEETVRAVAREAAAWAIEMAESLGVIRLRGYIR